MRGHGKIEGDDVGTVMAEQQRKFIPFYILRDACSVKGDQAVIMAAEPFAVLFYADGFAPRQKIGGGAKFQIIRHDGRLAIGNDRGRSHQISVQLFRKDDP